MKPIGSKMTAGSRLVKTWPQLAALSAVAFLLQGCAERKAGAHPWAMAVAAHPRVPPAAPAYQPPAIDDIAPDLSWDFPPPPSHLAVIRQPARPRVAAQPAPELSGNAKGEAPLLAPQLSEQEIAAAQLQMNESVTIAQKNLTAAKGRRLNTTQSDLASKVNSFLEDSRAAAKEGDWTRAKNLAKKAQVLSEELADSL
jgi:hypothetical protein